MKRQLNRIAKRKSTAVWVKRIESVESHEHLFSKAQVKDVSTSGILFNVGRQDILAERLRSTLTLEGLKGMGISFCIEGMKTPLEGVITRTRSLGKGSFEFAVDFREDAPEYWRQCLVDLLPDESGEF